VKERRLNKVGEERPGNLKTNMPPSIFEHVVGKKNFRHHGTKEEIAKVVFADHGGTPQKGAEELYHQNN